MSSSSNMKKFIIGAILLVASMTAGAQTTKVSEKADTTTVKSVNVKFDKETFESKTGKAQVTYIVLIDGKWYKTTKTSYERYFTIKRNGGTPCIVFIKKGKNTTVSVL